MEVPSTLEEQEVACMRCGRISKTRKKLSPRAVKARSRGRERFLLYTQVAALIFIAAVSTAGLLWVIMPDSGSGSSDPFSSSPSAR